MIRARIQNFQSIKDVELEIDGVTVITGPNNSGKSAIVRAISGVFQNPTAKPLIRNGEKALKVSLDFPDASVVWEKGTKAKYVINGREIENVGQSCPEEVLNPCRIRPIEVGSHTLWPQIADQISGVLFLTDKSGSVVAEAISDVERVGKLNQALSLSESDRREVKSKQKVRTQDREALRKKMSKFEGLDNVASTIRDLESKKAKLDKADALIREIRSIMQDIASCNVVLQIPNVEVPPPFQETEMLEKAYRIRDDMEGLRKALSYQHVPLPEYDLSAETVREAKALVSDAAKAETVRLQMIPSVPEGAKVDMLINAVSLVTETLTVKKDSECAIPYIPENDLTQSVSLPCEIRSVVESIREASLQEANALKESETISASIQEAVIRMGKCPVCEKP